ncbi:MAG: lamin tail domain-containing protein [Acidobacteria bacterium]|nr:lamin tail domain-containing protein [Acidobacteriota bacterium]
MYNSIESDDVEYIELYNSGPSSVDVTGWYLLDDDLAHDQCLLVGTLEPGGFLVVPGLMNPFEAKYPGVTNVNPNHFDNNESGRGWGLGNAGDEVRLYNAQGVLTDIVEFDDAAPWPTAADGSGPSLELYHALLDNNLPTSWGASTNGPPHGTPGAENSIHREDQAPLIEAVGRSVPLPGPGDDVAVFARVTDDESVSSVQLFVDEGSGYVPRPMFDDGVHGDGYAGDLTYGAFIAAHPDGTLVRYYISATDTLPQTICDPPLAPADHHGYTVGHVPPQLVINEVLPRNVNGMVDEAGQHEDWIEIKNRGAERVALGGMFLADNFTESRRWRFPPVSLDPGQRLLVWADSDTSQGPFHTDFKLSANGGSAALFDTADHGNTMIHGLRYGLAGADVSFGFYPEDARVPEYLFPSPNAPNALLYSMVCLNEMLTTSEGGGGTDDWVELYNRGDFAIDISGWYLSDDLDDPLRYAFPPGTVLQPGAFHYVHELTLGFSFASDGSEIVMLTKSDGVTGQDYYDYGPQTADVSDGRFPDGTADWHYLRPPTPGWANACNGTLQPGRVAALRFASASEIAWDAAPGASFYDVVKGDLATLRLAGDFTAALIQCVENDSPDLGAWTPYAPPAAGGWFYLVRGTNRECGFGSYDTGAASQVGSRDGEIAAAAHHCP